MVSVTLQATALYQAGTTTSPTASVPAGLTLYDIALDLTTFTLLDQVEAVVQFSDDDGASWADGTRATTVGGLHLAPSGALVNPSFTGAIPPTRPLLARSVVTLPSAGVFSVTATLV